MTWSIHWHPLKKLGRCPPSPVISIGLFPSPDSTTSNMYHIVNQVKTTIWERTLTTVATSLSGSNEWWNAGTWDPTQRQYGPPRWTSWGQKDPTNDCHRWKYGRRSYPRIAPMWAEIDGTDNRRTKNKLHYRQSKCLSQSRRNEGDSVKSDV